MKSPLKVEYDSVNLTNPKLGNILLKFCTLNQFYRRRLQFVNLRMLRVVGEEFMTSTDIKVLVLCLVCFRRT